MNHGAGWIIFEESYPDGTRRLLSILPARRNPKEVTRFLQQSYVDRFATIDEKLHFKKNPKFRPFSVLVDIHGGPMSIGHGPFYFAIYARKIVCEGNCLTFYYKIAANRDDPLNPVFEERAQSLPIGA